MSNPEETIPTTTPSAELSPEDRFMRDALALGPRPVRQKRRKALRIEVSQRTFDAARANPSELKILTKDVHGNAVVERPAQPRMTYAEMAERNQRLFAERRAEAQATRRLQDPGPSAPDQHWSEQRTWTGEVRYRPDDGSRNPFVTHVYDVFDVLKEDER
jgi:hypothetical protein